MIYLAITFIFVAAMSYKIGRYHGERRNYVLECKLEDAADRQGYKRGLHRTKVINNNVRKHTQQYVN